MARKGKEIALQREIETQEDWEDMLSKEGLCVVDVYQEWCGPAVGMVGTFRKIKNELGDDLLKFLTAKSDTIDALEKYRGRCEPCFLFFAGGVLVAVIRGANAPLILRTITEQLAQEHKVIDGQAERKEIKDTMIAKLEEQDKQKEDEEAEEEARRMRFQEEIVDFGDDDLDSEEEQKKEVSVVIIKPDAVQSGKAEEIMEEMKKRGIEILREERRQLTDEEVKNVYIHLQDESYFDDLVAFMTSAESIVLAITKGKTGENIIQEFRELIGPTDTEEAKEKAPESLRAKFGSDKYMNAVHGSDSSDTAARELAFFFPDFVAPEVDGAPKIQRTLALIRPDAYKNNKEQILAKIRESGFKVAMQKEIQLTKAEAEEFYKEHEGQDYFGELTDRMSSGPLLALGLAREDAVSGWRQMLGPTLVDDAKEKEPDSLRAQFAEEGAKVNMLHGSDSEERAQKEIEYFFPMEQTLAVIKPDAYQTKDEIIEKIHESGFRIAARKETTLSREIAEQFYADHQGKEFYNELVDHMCSGPTYFMVLSREGAVDGWRSLIGPTDPTQAKESHPDTLRGMYGQDPLRNAVHGSSNKEHAMQNIEKIFGELYFNKDGTVKEDKEGVPDVVVHEVPSLNPDHLEEAIAEQQDITYETAPENINSEEKQVQKESEPKPEPQQEEKPSSPKPEEKKEDADEDKPELPVTEQTGEQEVTEEQGPQQQEETKPTEQEPTQQEQSEAQEEKQDEEAQPAPEAAPEPTPEAGQEKAETEEKPKTPEAQAQEPEATPTEQTQAEPEKQPEQAEAKPADEQKEESKPDEPKPEETKPEETKPEESKPEESKPEETPKEEQTEAKPEAQAETTEEKKDEATTEQKEESKTDEQKPAEGEAQQTA